VYSYTRTPTHRQNRRLPVFSSCLILSLSLTYSLLYGITKPPYNLLKGDVARLIHSNVHALHPPNAARKITAGWKLHSDAIPQEGASERVRNDVFMAKGNRPFKYNLIGQLDSKLPAGCFTSPLTLCGGVYASGFDIVHQSS